MAADGRTRPDWSFFTWYYGLFNDAQALEGAIRDIGGDAVGNGDPRLAGTLDFIDNPLVAHSVAAELGLGEGVDVLDVGCGLGGPARLYASTGARVTAVDLLPQQVAACQHLNEITGVTGIEVVQGDAQRLPLEQERFDAYASIGALCHTYDRDAALREAFRVLRPGGSLSVADINQGPAPGPEFFGSRFWHLISCDDYERVTRDAGFVDVSVADLRLDYAGQIDIYVEVMKRTRPIFERRFGGAERFDQALVTYEALLDGLVTGTLGACWIRAERPGHRGGDLERST